MRILSIGKEITYPGLTIDTVSESMLLKHRNIQQYDYIIIHGGDGTIRRIVTQLHSLDKLPYFIINPTGSFNVIAKLHRTPILDTVLKQLSEGIHPRTEQHRYFRLNEHIFLFSAGNMGDLQHIFLSETLRFGWLKHGVAKYILSALFLLPVHLFMTPFMLMSKTRFFIFTPLKKIKKIGTFYGKVPPQLTIDLENRHNVLELDGDIVTVQERQIDITYAGNISLVIQ
jgi:hypothetical protein